MASDEDGANDPYWYASLGSGTAYNVPMPLTIHTSGNPDIHMNGARYETRPFQESGYYLYRIGHRDKHTGWELEFVHHKLYLVSEDPNIQHFEITHGYNLLSLNRLNELEWGKLQLRYGVGVVIAHPETTIYNQSFSQTGGLFSDGYFVSGGVVSVGVGRQFDLSKQFYLEADSKLYLSYSQVPVAHGYAEVSHASFNFNLTAGFRFR